MTYIFISVVSYLLGGATMILIEAGGEDER